MQNLLWAVKKYGVHLSLLIKMYLYFHDNFSIDNFFDNGLVLLLVCELCELHCDGYGQRDNCLKLMNKQLFAKLAEN